MTSRENFSTLRLSVPDTAARPVQPASRLQRIKGSKIVNQTDLGQHLQRLLATNTAARLIAPYGTYMQGGCLVLAKAIQALDPQHTTLLVTVRFEGLVTDHVIAKWHDLYLDGDGAGTLLDITEKMRLCESGLVSHLAALETVALHEDIQSDPATVAQLAAWLKPQLRLR